MTKYLLGYHGGGMPETPEEGDKVMKAWNSWMGTLGKSLLDGGNPAGAAKTVAPNGRVTDGGGANPVTGYSIIEAKGYRGTYVHRKAKANCKFNLQEWTLRKLSETIAELREAGVTDSEIRNAFAGAISRQLPSN